jgi:phage terminase large subunit-like protein
LAAAAVTKISAAPFTLEHFRLWSSVVVLDNDEPCRLEPFQEAFIEDVFSGRRICWLVIPEGNGKTTLMALLALYFCQFKPYSTVLAAAAAVEQASILYSQAEGMVLRTPELHGMTTSDVLKAKGKRSTDRPLFEPLEGWKRINCANGSRLQVKPADAVTGDGVIPDVCFVDELHRHGNGTGSLSLYRTWAGKLRKRKGQLIVISTAGEPVSEFEQTRQQMRESADEFSMEDCFTRAASETWVLHDWSVPASIDLDPENPDLNLVKRANPLSGVTVDTLQETWETPGMAFQHFSRFNANIPTRSTSAAIQEREWNQQETELRFPDEADVWAGLDVGWRWDTTAIVPFWWRDAQFRLMGPARIIEPPRDGSSTNPALLKKAFEELMARHRLSTVVMDTNKAEDIAAWLSDELELHVIDRAQTSKPQAEDYQRFMEGLRGGCLFHTGDQGLRQHALNAVAKMLPDGGAKFARSSETRQGGNQDARVIDALVAASMVHSYAVEKFLGPDGTPMVAWG